LHVIAPAAPWEYHFGARTFPRPIFARAYPVPLV
jgi:hypothetical protein